MGSGFRVWTAGEVVSASNVNNYLQEQTVMSFAGTAARSSAIASPEEGMLSYLQDTDTYQGYDGTNWVNLNTLSGTDTSGLVHINTTTISSGVTGVSLNNVFSATYKNYLILASIITSTGNSNSMRLRVGGTDNTANQYIRQVIAADSGSLATSSLTSTAFDGFWIGSSTVAILEAYLYNPFETSPTMHLSRTMAGAGNSFKVSGGIHTASTSFDGFTLNAASGTLTSGTVRVYGFKD